ncbi:tyrosine phosphatase family-domain-containing protein [Calycina marina]|uniref:Tyrosine phosphatase family-domain-containing protein n=1 Tax=Calycina marina TaxID=1763456 RepID=A0A9P7YWI4_9HELO|nr:tyrosine phosphatase family-domain-containing protein [Calycina marina]
MGKSSIAQISRRSTRLFEEDASVTTGEDSNIEKQRSSRGPSVNGETRAIAMGELDVESSSLGGLEDMGRKGALYEAPQTCEHKLISSCAVQNKPLNFGTVVEGKIYRSSFPVTDDFQFLQTLGLKTIVSLVDKEWDPEFLDFMNSNGIDHRIVEMAGTKKVDIPQEVMQKIIGEVLNQGNFPLLIHCNHGKHRTGCAVAVVRLVHGWPVEHVIDEYRGYAEPKIRDCDLKYIREYEVSSLTSALVSTIATRPVASILTSSKIRYVGAAAILLIWLATVMTLRKP